MTEILDLIRHMPEHLSGWAESYGTGIYFILALIIFAETGLVVTPFLPGDSLLFAVGVVVSNTQSLDIYTMLAILIGAAVLGDTVNFHVGRFMAPRLFRNPNSRFLNPKHLEKTRAFYAKHGGKTVVLARFLPILRTYTPFVTGMSDMPYSKFLMFSVGGGVLWVSLFTLAGYYFGNLPGVQSNFHYAILGIIVISVLPIAYELVQGLVKEGRDSRPRV